MTETDEFTRRVLHFRWILLLLMVVPVVLFILYLAGMDCEIVFLVFGVPITVANALAWGTPDDFIEMARNLMKD